MKLHQIMYESYVCEPTEYRYSNGRLAIRYIQPKHNVVIATLTVNIPEYTDLKENEIIVKTWSENKLFAQEVLKTGDFEDTGKRIPLGFVEAQVWKIL